MAGKFVTQTLESDTPGPTPLNPRIYLEPPNPEPTASRPRTTGSAWSAVKQPPTQYHLILTKSRRVDLELSRFQGRYT